MTSSTPSRPQFACTGVTGAFNFKSIALAANWADAIDLRALALRWHFPNRKQAVSPAAASVAYERGIRPLFLESSFKDHAHPGADAKPEPVLGLWNPPLLSLR